MKKMKYKVLPALTEKVHLNDYFGVKKSGMRYMLQSKSLLLDSRSPAIDGWSIFLAKGFTQKDTTRFEDQLNIGQERTLEEIIIHLIDNGAEVYSFGSFIELAKWATDSN